MLHVTSSLKHLGFTPANLQSFTDCSWRMTCPIGCWSWTKRGSEDEGREEGEETSTKMTKRFSEEGGGCWTTRWKRAWIVGDTKYADKIILSFSSFNIWRWVFLLSKFAKSRHFQNFLSKINHTWLLHIQYLRSCKCFTFPSCIILVSVASVSKRHIIQGQHC